jgi:type IV pilus assembly protein PilV
VWQPLSHHIEPGNSSGFTLVELLVAMVIMLIGLLGLMYSVEIAMEHNLKNQMRGEVVRIAEEAMSNMRSRAFDSVSSGQMIIPSKLRNINRSYTVKQTVVAIPNPTPTVVSRQYHVDVKWLYKNVSTTHSIVTVRSRAE